MSSAISSSQGQQRLVRIAYFDESGSTTDHKTEPIVVVAAVVVHGDHQSGPIEREAEEIVRDLVPNRLKDGFEFHGKEMLSALERVNDS